MWAMIGGVGVAVLGALVAAKLARVDRLWGGAMTRPRRGSGIDAGVSGGVVDRQIAEIQAVLRQAVLARGDRGEGSSSGMTGRAMRWQALRARVSSPMLGEGVRLLSESDGAEAETVRTRLTQWHAAQAAQELRCAAAARWASVLAPVLGYGLIGVAAMLSVRQLQVALAADAAGASVSVGDLLARGGDGASGVMALMIIVIAAPLMNAMSRRLSRHAGRSAREIHQREALSVATIEGFAAVAAGHDGAHVVAVFDRACEEAGLIEHADTRAGGADASSDAVLGRSVSPSRPLRAA
jgi:hypothetical protein